MHTTLKPGQLVTMNGMPAQVQADPALEDDVVAVRFDGDDFTCTYPVSAVKAA